MPLDENGVLKEIQSRWKHKYKARLVAEGFTQQPGVDFVDKYSHVAKFASVRIIISIVAKFVTT
jgi:hypothetical protein